MGCRGTTTAATARAVDTGTTIVLVARNTIFTAATDATCTTGRAGRVVRTAAAAAAVRDRRPRDIALKSIATITTVRRRAGFTNSSGTTATARVPSTTRSETAGEPVTVLTAQARLGRLQRVAACVAVFTTATRAAVVTAFVPRRAATATAQSDEIVEHGI